VRSLDGKVTGSKGDPESFSSKGRCCGKSMARIADLYHPGRVVRPLKRTNPVKGIGVDPEWEEITWEEALETVVEKLRSLREDDPRKLSLASFDATSHLFQYAFCKAFGSPNVTWCASNFCGAGLHAACMVTLGSCGNSEPDTERCDYLVQWGSQFGMGANNVPMVGARQMAAARKRGAKLVVVDPICSHAAAKADQWIPIIPGTDGALGLCLSNLLVNEFGLYDEEFLKKKTNAPYLIGADGHYIRDETDGKPFVWDAIDGRSKPYDDSGIGDEALEGSYEIAGEVARPAFELLREHLRRYGPEEVSGITGVPQGTIRRFARELGEAAQIGATFDYRGHTLPLRPACIETKSGASRHKNGFWNVYSVYLPNILIGAMNVPGGLLATGGSAPFGAGGIEASQDGLIMWSLADELDVMGACPPYPPREVGQPENIDIRELFPCHFFSSTLPILTSLEPEKVNLPYKPEALIISRFNPMVSTVDRNRVAEMLAKMDFVMCFAIYPDETTEFADIVIPEAHDYERWCLFPANTLTVFLNSGPGPWQGQTLQPVVDPPEGVRHWAEFMMDVADGLGVLPEMNEALNAKGRFGASGDQALSSEQKYTMQELAQRSVRLWTDKDVSNESFKDHSCIELGEKTVEESFPGLFSPARIPVYFEHFIDAGKSVREATRRMGMEWWDVSPYHPLPEWHPCVAHQADDSEFDLFIANSKLPLHQQTLSSRNVWVDDLSVRNPLDYFVLIHTSVAKERDIQDGDLVWIESEVGRVKGKARVTECVHPRVVGTFGTLGRWGEGSGAGCGKGVHFNSLIKLGWDMVDTLSGQMDYCAKVKVYKA
jgi:anaerobic selenocysteine-containing dehydrogenase